LYIYKTGEMPELLLGVSLPATKNHSSKYLRAYFIYHFFVSGR